MAEFDVDISRFIRKTGVAVETALRKIVLDISTSVIMDTPVDTGRARGNWVVGVDTINWDATNSPDPSGSDTLRRVSNTVSAIEWKRDRSVYLTNTLAYILPLEYGHSGQAPQGMVRKNLSRFQTIVKRSAK